MSLSRYLSPEVDVPILQLLWRWKVLSTAALSQVFLKSGQHPNTIYNRLLLLKHKGYVTIRRDERGQYALWSLDQDGFRAIRDLLPLLREEGYRSEAPYHDWLASAFHLGGWLVELPPGVEMFSEQELRRVDPEDYPDWLPKSLGHRSDGYWHRIAENGPRTLALEMELSRKQARDYREIGTAYGESRVGRVLWVVRTLTDAKRIKESLDKGIASRPAMHSFVRLDSFLKQEWSAPVEQGAGLGLSVASFLQKALGIPELEKGRERPEKTPGHGPITALLETRIKRIQSTPSAIPFSGEKALLTADSIAVSPIAVGNDHLVKLDSLR